MMVHIDERNFSISVCFMFIEYAALIKDFDYKSSIALNTYVDYAYTNYMFAYCGVIDHIFFDQTTLKFSRSIPMPTHEEVTRFTALPSQIIPSDHLAVVVDLEMLT